MNSLKNQTVVVTGGTGYLAGWIAHELLKRGSLVRCTVRDPARAEPVRQEILNSAAGSLEFMRADLLADDGWDAVFTGADAVVHAASPMPFDAAADLIASAREGTGRVLAEAARAGIERVVMTSSGTAARPRDPAATANETMWSEPSGAAEQAYPDSKIHAERLAWELAGERGLKLTAILPSFMQGPPVGAPRRAGTLDVIRRLLSRQLPALPHLGWNVADVRDVARLHVQALENPVSIGQRYNGSGTFLWYREIARMIKAGLPEARRVPTIEMPNFLVRFAARRDPQLAMIVDELGITRTIDTSKAREELGWETRDPQATILDGARALLASPHR